MTECTRFNHYGVALSKRYFHKPLVTELFNHSVTRVYVEQPRLHRVLYILFIVHTILFRAQQKRKPFKIGYVIFTKLYFEM